MFPTSFSRRQQYRPAGGVAAPIIIILAALMLSAAVFFLFTRKKMAAKAQQEDAKVTTTIIEKAPSPTANPSAPVEAPKPVVEQPKPAPVFGFARPGDVGEQLMRSLASNDVNTAAKLMTTADPAQEPAVKAMLEKVKEMGYVPAKPDQVQVLGQTGAATRLGIPLLKADGTDAGIRLFLDVIKDPKMGWKISGITLPKELESAMAAAVPAAAPAPAGTPGAPVAASKPAGKSLMSVSKGPDALVLASDFVQALLKLNVDKARAFVDEERVPPVKLAALCIVFEDGQYALQANRPLTTTVATETTNWVIVKVQSELRKEETEFGLEMENQADKWRITGLNLSKLLSDSSQSSTLVGVPYTPLVQNPKGGESIALYFEYDSDVMHPRAVKQLEIVSAILKASPERKLKIGGYTDARGTDNYNLNLSQKRAGAVKQAIIDQGVPLEQVETVGFGAADPLKPNANPDGTDNPEGRSRNRRAEILLDF